MINPQIMNVSGRDADRVRDEALPPSGSNFFDMNQHSWAEFHYHLPVQSVNTASVFTQRRVVFTKSQYFHLIMQWHARH